MLTRRRFQQLLLGLAVPWRVRLRPVERLRIRRLMCDGQRLPIWRDVAVEMLRPGDVAMWEDDSAVYVVLGEPAPCPPPPGHYGSNWRVDVRRLATLVN